ncbi:DUF433 domain-containing protein [Duganella vulcania]|nr:DUF433 domain-containing protein [Duganella vulcania]
MKYESSHLEQQRDGKEMDCLDDPNCWLNVMPNYDDEIEIDEDGPEYDPRYFAEPVHKFRGRIIPPRKSPTDPFDPELLAYMKSITPLVQMEPDILGGMPVFKGTLVPIKRMFDYLLAGKPMDDFLADYPTVSHDMATGVLENDATLFYEAISKAIDSAAMPSSLPR